MKRLYLASLVLDAVLVLIGWRVGTALGTAPPPPPVPKVDYRNYTRIETIGDGVHKVNGSGWVLYTFWCHWHVGDGASPVCETFEQ